MDERLVSNVQSSIYRVLAPDGSTAGTAFAAGEGLILTCMHVLDQAKVDQDGRYALIHQQSGAEVFAAPLLECSRPSKQEDVAVLKHNNEGDCHSSLSLGIYGIEPGASIYSFGFPEIKNHEGMPGRATVIGPASENEYPVIAVSSPQISIGFSGAPAVDEVTGLVVGIVVSIAKSDSFGRLGDSAFLIPSLTVLRLCPQATVGTHPLLKQFTVAIRKQLNRSPYYIAGLPEFTLLESFQKPELTRLEFGPIDWNQYPYTFDEFSARLTDASTPMCLIGAAGSGKSTLLRYCALRLAESAEAENAILPLYLNAKTLQESVGLDFSERVKNVLRRDSSYGFDLELPNDFVRTWTRKLSARFLVIIDACDELTDLRERNQFLRAVREDISPYLKENGHALVIASRDVGQLEAIKKSTTTVLVGTLPESSRNALSEKVLGGDAEEFRKFVDRMEHRQLIFSPLTLLLLLALFRKKKARYDVTLVGVYEAILATSDEEWRRRGIQATVGSEVADFAIDALSITAWNDMGENFDEDEVTSALAEFLAAQTSRGRFGAAKVAEKLYRFLSEDAGLLKVADGKVSWVHQNIRDYLAARALCIFGEAIPNTNRGLTRNVSELVDDYWSDASRESFVRFVLCMLPDRNAAQLSVENLLARDRSAIAFVARAISDGAPLSHEFIDRFARELLTQSSQDFGTCHNVFTPSDKDTVPAFMLVAWKEPFLSCARDALTGDHSLDSIPRPREFQQKLAVALSRTCSSAQLQDLNRDTRIDGEIRRLFEVEKKST